MKPSIFVDSPETLTAALHQHIPISQHMGLTVRDYTGSSLVLSAPLANNINHQLTAFGGSLFAVAALAGWGLLQMKLSEMLIDGNTVIADGSVSYLKPVTGELVCRCNLPESWPQHAQELSDRGKTSLTLEPVFMTGADVAMQFSARYAVREKTP